MVALADLPAEAQVVPPPRLLEAQPQRPYSNPGVIGTAGEGANGGPATVSPGRGTRSSRPRAALTIGS